ncbi:MAG: type II secretion system GspH family protein [Lentisphaeraceae bacterium]|nr:type II secretion system GspH family protein [Lentisphaeraceae bacterium]
MKKTFTLIELLVVVAIIGILASMILPSLSESRAKVKTAVCVSNLKQVGAALQMFCSEGNGLLPGPMLSGFKTGYRSSDGSFLSTKLAVFSGMPEPSNTRTEHKLFSCPSYTGTDAGDTALNAYQFQTHGQNSSGSRYMGYPNSSFHVIQSLSAAEDASAETFTMEMDQVLITGTPGWLSNISSEPRHGFKGNAGYRTMLFYDGHVEATTKLAQQ